MSFIYPSKSGKYCSLSVKKEKSLRGIYNKNRAKNRLTVSLKLNCSLEQIRRLQNCFVQCILGNGSAVSVTMTWASLKSLCGGWIKKKITALHYTLAYGTEKA